MKKYYLAAFMPAPEGGYDIVVPDIPNAFTCADSLEEGFEMAEEVVSMMLRDLVENKKPLPEPTDMESVKAKTAEYLRSIGHVPADEILYQLIPAPNTDQSPVKVTISLPRSVLDTVDTLAKAEGMTRSGFLAKTAEVYQVEHSGR